MIQRERERKKEDPASHDHSRALRREGLEKRGGEAIPTTSRRTSTSKQVEN